MNTSLAIQKAVEGGYDNAVAREHLEAWKQHETLTTHDYGWIFLSPDFWQALGKIEGWDKKPKEMTCEKCGTHTTFLYQKQRSKAWNGYEKENDLMHYGCPSFPHGYYNFVWKIVQHRLIDAIQQGRSIDEFFGEILKK